MSLINDALKKAARQRAQEESGVAPLRTGGGVAQSTGQREPMSTQNMILIGAAALVLIVVSAVVTGMLIAGKFESKPAAALAAAPAPAAPAPAAAGPAPAIAISLPKPVPAPAAAPAPVVAAPAPVVVTTPVPTAPPAAAPPSVAVIPAPAATAAQASAAQAQNDLIQNMVDKYHVSGVRAAATDSKALIDGHVYRQGEFLDRSLGLKLVGVDQDHLTFTDKAGNTYIKSF
jgi:hypothetical protein